MTIFRISKPRSTPVTLTRSAHSVTRDVALWVVIRNSCNQLDFRNYMRFVDDVMAVGSLRRKELGVDGDLRQPAEDRLVLDEYGRSIGDDPQRLDEDRNPRWALLPFTASDRYALLKAATEVFVMAKCGVDLEADFDQIVQKQSDLPGSGLELGQVTASLWKAYLDRIGGPDGKEHAAMLPYYGIILDKLKDVFVDPDGKRQAAAAYRVLRRKLVHPCFLELICVPTGLVGDHFHRYHRGPGDHPVRKVAAGYGRPDPSVRWKRVRAQVCRPEPSVPAMDGRASTDRYCRRS